MGSREWYEAEEPYECPMCLGIYLLRENKQRRTLDEVGEFRVRGRVEGEEADPAVGTPGSMWIEEILSVDVLNECPHSDMEEVHEIVEKEFKMDFNDGYIEPEFQDDYDEPVKR